MKNVNKAVVYATAIITILLNTVHAQVLDSSTTKGIEIKTIYSKILGEKRKIRIQVPSGSNKHEAYPVLYVLDGEAQHVLAAGQVQYLSESYKILPDMIVVGIDNTDRMRDLTPTKPLTADGKKDTAANSPFRNTGGGEKFLQFIKEELMPFIESRYKTGPYRMLTGHSLGALMALHCLANHPDYFNAYIAISPSLQWDNNTMLTAITEGLKKQKLSNTILFFSDANEDVLFHSNQLKLDSTLKTLNISGLQYKRMFYPEETHISEPVKAFYDGIRTWHLPYNTSSFRKTMTAKIIKDHYAALSKTYGYNVLPLHDEMNAISRFLRNDVARINDAIELLQWNVANYPASPIALETLGDTYLKIGDKEKAVTAFKKALELDNTNEALKKKLNQ
jgi:predicted alpha/beta superfamily hydrolase